MGDFQGYDLAVIPDRVLPLSIILLFLYSEDFDKCCSKTVIANLLLPLFPKSEIKSEFGNYCKMCKQNFTGKSKLQNHIASAHMNIKYSCTECDQTFTSESGML